MQIISYYVYHNLLTSLLCLNFLVKMFLWLKLFLLNKPKVASTELLNQLLFSQTALNRFKLLINKNLVVCFCEQARKFDAHVLF